jgi:hypothetical protein
MYVELSRKYPALVNRRRVLLQQDKRLTAYCQATKEKLRELDVTELPPRPAYKLDREPSDFHLSRAMAHFVRGRSFKTIDDVEMGCRERLASKDKAWYRRGIELLAERWVRRIIFICWWYMSV